MNFSSKAIQLVSVTFILILGVFLVYELRPSHRVERSLALLLKNIENRKWKNVESFIASDYRDRWGFDRSMVMQALPDVCRHFLYMNFVTQETRVRLQKDTATITCKIRLQGNGTAVAAEAMERINTLSSPFIFTYRKRSWKPWDWVLEKVDQPELVVSPDY